MEKIISLPFKYEEQEYYTLVSLTKGRADHTELRITIMNGDLQTKLNGNDRFIFKDGKLYVDVPSEAKTIAKLKINIAQAVNNYLEKHPWAENGSTLISRNNQ